MTIFLEALDVTDLDILLSMKYLSMHFFRQHLPVLLSQPLFSFSLHGYYAHPHLGVRGSSLEA